jgi:undecaprenyl-diphosphatase
MTLLHALIIGIIEGVTEFLPVSSTGHIVLTSHLLRIPQTEFLKSFEVAIQLGAILSVVVLYGKRLIVSKTALARVMTAFIPTAIIGFVMHDIVKEILLESVSTVLWALLIGGIAIVVFETMHEETSDATGTIEEISTKQALLIGLFQSLALVPGVSRAAATIIGGLLLGTKRQTIVEFSFLLAIPTMAAATGYDLLKTSASFSQQEFLLLAVGFISACMTALLVIRWLMQFIAKHSFAPFGYYRIAAGCIGLLILITVA